MHVRRRVEVEHAGQRRLERGIHCWHDGRVGAGYIGRDTVGIDIGTIGEGGSGSRLVSSSIGRSDSSGDSCFSGSGFSGRHIGQDGTGWGIGEDRVIVMSKDDESKEETSVPWMNGCCLKRKKKGHGLVTLQLIGQRHRINQNRGGRVVVRPPSPRA